MSCVITADNGTTSGSAGLKHTADSSGALSIKVGSGSVTAATFDASGNMGIGVTPSAWGSPFTALQFGPNGGSLNARTDSNQAIELALNWYYDGANSKYINTNYATRYRQYAGAHEWYTAASGTAGNTVTFTTAMTLTSGGLLLVGKTTAGSLAQNGSEFSGTTGNCLFTLPNSTADTLNVYNTTATAYRFYVTSGGTVYATNTTISAISDARLKENIRDINDGLANILALRPRVFDWKEGKGADKKNVRGFIAQEVEAVRPDLIDEWKDPAPKGEEPYKSVRQDLIPDIVAAIQELATENTELKQRIAALEAK